jgi:hypothetical protein
LATIYEETGQTTQLITTLEQIVQLPDDMVLERENWPSIKEQFQDKLDQLKSSGE